MTIMIIAVTTIIIIVTMIIVRISQKVKKSPTVISATTPPVQPCPSPATPTTPCVTPPAPAGKSYAWIWIGLIALIIAGLVFYSASDKPKNDDATTQGEGTLVDPHESWQDYIMSRGLL